MKQFLLSILTLLLTIGFMMAISTLFNLPFIDQHISRKLIIWLLIIVVLLIGFKIIIEINNQLE